MEFVVFKTYNTIEEAEELIGKLTESNILSHLGDNKATFDVTFSNSTIQDKYEVKIKQEDFVKAKQILKEESLELINEIDRDYYLFEFSDEELYDIILKSDEWSEFDFSLSQKILKERGKAIDPSLISSLQKQRINDLAKPDTSQSAWIVIGFVMAFIGGILGVLIGYHFWKSKKTLPNGERVFNYSKSDRLQGKYIFILGAILFPIILLWKLIPMLYLLT